MIRRSDLHASDFRHVLWSTLGALSVGKSTFKPHRKNTGLRLKVWTFLQPLCFISSMTLDKLFWFCGFSFPICKLRISVASPKTSLKIRIFKSRFCYRTRYSTYRKAHAYIKEKMFLYVLHLTVAYSSPTFVAARYLPAFWDVVA